MATIAILSSFVATSRVGGFAQALAFAALGHEATLVPTVLFGRHPGLGAPGGGAVGPETFEGVLHGAEANRGFRGARMILTGYFALAEQVEMTADAIDRTKLEPAPPFVLVDPIMGDEVSGAYVKPEVEAAIRAHLIPRADLIAPNLWELARLTGRAITTADEAVAAARTLNAPVLVSSVPAGPDEIGVLYVGPRNAWLAAHARAFEAPKGTGDLLTALFAVGLIEGLAPETALVRATGGVAGAVEAAIAQDLPDLPIAALGDSFRAPKSRVVLSTFA
jgi:pyridoxine kinase